MESQREGRGKRKQGIEGKEEGEEIEEEQGTKGAKEARRKEGGRITEDQEGGQGRMEDTNVDRLKAMPVLITE